MSYFSPDRPRRFTHSLFPARPLAFALAPAASRRHSPSVRRRIPAPAPARSRSRRHRLPRRRRLRPRRLCTFRSAARRTPALPPPLSTARPAAAAAVRPCVTAPPPQPQHRSQPPVPVLAVSPACIASPSPLVRITFPSPSPFPLFCTTRVSPRRSHTTAPPHSCFCQLSKWVVTKGKERRS
jgi:hypothetical protein